jgi:hypothetical protein
VPTVSIQNLKEGGIKISVIEISQSRTMTSLLSIPQLIPFPEITIKQSYRLEASCR